MLSALRHHLRRRKLDRHAPDPVLFQRVLDYFPVLDDMDAATRENLYRRTTEILADKEFHGAAGLELAPEEHLAVAVLAALPVLVLGSEWYRHFHTFIVYPSGFFADYEEADEVGVVHRGRDLRAGEAWAHGPVVLSLEDIEASGQGQGYNVVVHELAHQLDQINGDMDGFPPLHRDMDASEWASTFADAYQRLEQQLDAGIQPAIDPYAAESPAEYFAVTSEYFFDAPGWLRQHEPAVYRLLEALYWPSMGRGEEG
ncbi:zinc-dependent peptidase [Wenzhouxiangella sp. AB-CW3]|uniref:M90 family metallopeptidase n=1 Tax=Wenzhouxiangella sp. AB-CW3 TaxID=2771012 RepID=UPI00168C0911|nr:M90 family metallopeptidase [Wenzhouxiangella sp. AB-CW3]QOC21682.1 zinc-dependent peptidase [Wenzhouxiangella sp. AB-CW3]